jgi:hypothetical protein
MSAQWLKMYYGKDFDVLNPEVVKEGKKWAIVKLNRHASRGFSSIGYVLIKKNGTHAASHYHSLHEGVPTKEAMDMMYKRLAEAEENE